MIGNACSCVSGLAFFCVVWRDLDARMRADEKAWFSTDGFLLASIQFCMFPVFTRLEGVAGWLACAAHGVPLHSTTMGGRVSSLSLSLSLSLSPRWALAAFVKDMITRLDSSFPSISSFLCVLVGLRILFSLLKHAFCLLCTDT